MREFTVLRDDDANLTFSGEQVAKVSNHSHEGPRGNRWMVLELYRTAAGRLICQRVGRTIWQGERDRYEAAVCEADAAGSAEEKAIVFFGYSDLAKELYRAAGIDADQQVE
jgi:hypothetical protein